MRKYTSVESVKSHLDKTPNNLKQFNRQSMVGKEHENLCRLK